MSRITVDGEVYEVTEGENLLHACLSHGLDLPYFCWHPEMGSVGACRQCAVVAYQDEEDTRGRLTMACMTPVADGARIDIKAPHAEEFRASVIEWLMENHPHDCPVCEEGGECHLQDMTVMTGHTTRQYRGTKRTFENQYLGPFINHEMNRCITCYRCVRFYRDYAGGDDLAAFGSRDRMYFGRAEPGVLENEFSGNLVEVCPTGVFTDKPFSAMYSRKWDLQSAPSICTGCSMGCNTFASERYGTLKRIHNRYHPDINKYFLCDRGRFGMSYVNSTSRIRQTGERTAPGVFRAVSTDDAIAQAAKMIETGRTIGIGSPRASLEDNWALKKLVGEDNFCAGFSDAESRMMSSVLALGDLKPPSLTEVESADVVVILGEDLLNTAPRLALAIRQASRNLSHDMAADAAIPQWQDAGVRGHAQHASNPIFIACPLPTRLDDIAHQTLHATPQVIAISGAAIAQGLNRDSAVTATEDEFVNAAITALQNAEKPLIVTGVSLLEPALIDAAAQITRALQHAGKAAHLVVTGAEANSFGVGQLGGQNSVEASLQSVVDGQTQTLLVLENDLFRRADPTLVTSALDAAENVIVVDCLDNATADHAHLVFPAASVAESTGTLVNYERRAQRFYQVFVSKDDIQPAWRWLVACAKALGTNDMGWTHVDDVLQDLARQPGFADITKVAPTGDYRSTTGQRVPRESHRYSGRTAMNADTMLHEPKTPVDDETPFSYSMEGSMEGSNADQPSTLIPYVWSPGWNSNQSVFKFQQEIGGELKGGEPGVHLAGQTQGGVLPTPAKQPHGNIADANSAFTLIPAPALFGGEELSAYSPAIEQRMPTPFVVVHPEDAARLGVAAGDGILCGKHSLEVRTHAAMAFNTAAVPAGLPNAPSFLTEQPVTLTRDDNFVRRPTIIARG